MNEQDKAQQAAEAQKVLAYQRGYNDRMTGRDKDSGTRADSVGVISYGAYLQGWHDAGTLQKKK